uniref:Uncharacterized protein n=1 Tax=Anguilla anguilla TaxID=7936 RepID=A0A0E9VQS2_ANGAN
MESPQRFIEWPLIQSSIAVNMMVLLLGVAVLVLLLLVEITVLHEAVLPRL